VAAGRVSPDRDRAARLTGTLWETVCFSGGTGTGTYRHFREALDPAWLGALPLPGAPGPGRPVALIDAVHRDLERHIESATLRAACEHRPRTRVYEDTGHGGDGWAALAAAHLTRLSGSALPVLCSVYESGHGDESFGAHRDAWFGAVVQVAGVKDWQIGEGLLGAAGPPAAAVTMTAGDVLLMPKSLPHLVTTPADPGWSVHLAFALDRDPPPVPDTLLSPLMHPPR
jgi:hypothetical protein